MATQDDIRRTLENVLCNKTGNPLKLSLHFLQSITNDFSKENLIGSGGFGDVYKGVLENGNIAVKKLHSQINLDGKSFLREVHSLMNIRHQNTVLFVGYCSERQEETQERLLCFEYLLGNLRKYISDMIVR